VEYVYEDVNIDRMIDRTISGDRMYNYEVVVCPKARLLFCNTLKNINFSFTKGVHTFRA